MTKYLPTLFVLWLLRFYQWTVSPLKEVLFGPYMRCRFSPSCSEYARQCFLRHGFWRGLRYTLWRLARCHPFHPGGEDLVPVRKEKKCGVAKRTVSFNN